jgi:hypothetical protein
VVALAGGKVQIWETMSALLANRRWPVLAGGPFVLGSFWLLAHCGGGSSGSPNPGPDGSGGYEPPVFEESGADSTAPDGTLGSEGGAVVDAPAEAAPDAAVPLDGAADGPIDSSSVDSSPVDSSVSDGAGAACNTQTPCADSGSLQCCNGICVDTSADPNNCGSCSNACTSTQFCNGTSCYDTILANVCKNPRGTVVGDSYYSTDTLAGIAMGHGLSASCTPVPSIVQSQQTALGVLEMTTNRPITGVGNTFIAGGGAFGQEGIAYMEGRYTSLYLSNDGTTSNIVNRNTGSVAMTLDSNLTSTHDYFYVQVAVEPASGTLCFEAAGIYGPGTVAAGYFVQNIMMADPAKYTNSWYVFAWTAAPDGGLANGVDGGGPGPSDTFTQLAP